MDEPETKSQAYMRLRQEQKHLEAQMATQEMMDGLATHQRRRREATLRKLMFPAGVAMICLAGLPLLTLWVSK
jgi:hypothetical protein